MKHLNFLSNLLSLSLGSPCTDVSLDRRLTVGSPSLDYRSKLLRLVAISAFLLTIGVGNAWGAGAISVTNSAITLPRGSTTVTTGDWIAAAGVTKAGNSWAYSDWTGDQTIGTYGSITFSKAGDLNNANLLQLQSGGGTISTTITSPAGVDIVIGCKRSGTKGTVTVSLTGADDDTSFSSTSWSTIEISTTSTTAVFSVTKSGDNGLYISYITITPKAASSTYSVTYDGNGNTGGDVPTDATAYSSGATVTVKGNTGSLVKTGYTFGGWNTQADGNGTNYTAGSGTFSISSNTTLYAKWTANNYTVHWKVDGEDWEGSTHGSPSTNANYNTKPATIPTAPVSGDCDGTKVFVGWTNSTYSHASSAPSILFTSQSSAPAITGNTTFHAVFANRSGSAPVASTITGSYASHTGWTESNSICTGGSGSDTYWVLCTGGTLTSPIISDLSTVTSITFSARTYGGSSYKTINVKTSGNTSVGSANASSNTLTSGYSISVSGLTGSGSLVFSSSTTAASSGPGIDAITINYTTGGYTYSNYATTCCTELGSIKGSFFMIHLFGDHFGPFWTNQQAL